MEAAGRQKLSAVLPRFELNNVALRLHHVTVTFRGIADLTTSAKKAEIAGDWQWDLMGKLRLRAVLRAC
jgi:hypothetical protein